MKYVLVILVCIVCIIGGVFLGIHINAKNTPMVVIAPGTAANLLQCSDIMPITELKTFAGGVVSVTGSTTITVKTLSGKTVGVLVDGRTIIQLQTPKDSATLAKEQLAYQQAIAKARAAATTTRLILSPSPFNLSNLSITDIKPNMQVTIVSNESVVGKGTVRASSVIVTNSTSTATRFNK